VYSCTKHSNRKRKPKPRFDSRKKKSKNHSYLHGSIGNDIGASPTPGQHMHNVNDLSIEHYIYKELPNNLPVEDNNNELPAIQ
jgi:hypothetical protein